ENEWHNVTLSVRPGQFFNCYVDGQLKYSENCPVGWSLNSDKTTLSIGGRVMWNNGYNTFRGWIDDVCIYNFAQSLEQAEEYRKKGKIVMRDMAGEIITSIASTPVFENGVALNREVMDNMSDRQVVNRINNATVNAVMDDGETVVPLSVDWKGYKRENGVWYISGYIDAQNVGYVTSLTGRVEIKVEIEVTKAPRFITVKDADNGTVSTESDRAYLDDRVLISVTPDEGYKVESVKVNGATVLKNENEEYVYVVEGTEDMEITATFVADGQAADRDRKAGNKVKTAFIISGCLLGAIVICGAIVLFVKKKTKSKD
ncbi:MAG TPA: hypothetical protein DDW54_00805, partial [Clostridiales bacterium]|nr:hypothetical protein [Clostridiales bacterium]